MENFGFYYIDENEALDEHYRPMNMNNNIHIEKNQTKKKMK